MSVHSEVDVTCTYSGALCIISKKTLCVNAVTGLPLVKYIKVYNGENIIEHFNLHKHISALVVTFKIKYLDRCVFMYCYRDSPWTWHLG